MNATSTTTTLRIDTELKRELDMYALKDNRSLNNLIETILIKWIDEQKEKEKTNTR